MKKTFTWMTQRISDFLATPLVSTIVIIFLILWAFLGPTFDFSTNWRDVIKLTAAIFTLITTFLLRYNQMRDTKAIQIKLDELLRTKKEARSSLINLENCTDEELDDLTKQFEKIRKERNSI